MTPTVAATTIEGMCLLAVLCNAKRFGVSRSTALLIALSCLPVPVVIIATRPIFAFDLAGPIVLSMVHATNPRVTSSARGLAVTYGMGLVLWPLFATILATAVLNEHSSLADCAVFFLRSCFAVGAFVWAHRTAASPRSTSTISFVAIPTLFWFVYAIAGIMQYLGVLDTNVFWAYHDPANQRNVTTGFMAMDAPQISVWATFGAAWALWLSETAKGWLRWLLLCMPSTSIILCICVASRYGLVGSCLATLLTSAVVIRGRSGMTRLAFAAVVIAALIPFASQYWDVLPLEQKQHIETKFAILAAIRSPSEALDARDSSTQFLIQYIDRKS